MVERVGLFILVQRRGQGVVRCLPGCSAESRADSRVALHNSLLAVTTPVGRACQHSVERVDPLNRFFGRRAFTA